MIIRKSYHFASR